MQISLPQLPLTPPRDLISDQTNMNDDFKKKSTYGCPSIGRFFKKIHSF